MTMNCLYYGDNYQSHCKTAHLCCESKKYPDDVTITVVDYCKQTISTCHIDTYNIFLTSITDQSQS